jgi:hypothetical protein
MSGKDLPNDPDALRADVERTRRDLGDTVEALVHKADVPGRVKEKTHEGVEQVKETATRANAAVSAAAGKTTAAVSHAAEEVGHKAAHAVESLPPPVQQRLEQGVQQVRRHPGAVAAVAAAVLMLLWRMMRRGRTV